MKAIFNREFNSYFTSLLGYVFLTIFLLITGAMFSFVNIFQYQTANMTYFFASINTLAVFLLPLITMRLFSEDKKLKTDRLLMTAPVSAGEIVFGKFLAALSVLLLGAVITFVYPITLAFLGELPVAETISCYIGFILMCSVILAIGAFMSSVTESQIVAAITTYGIIILIMLLPTAAQFIPSETVSSGLLWLSPIQRFSDFTLGILNFEPIIYYLSLVALFLYFTMTAIERRRKNNTVFVIIAVIIAVLVNVFVSILTSKLPLKIDMTTNSMFEISDKTKEYLKTYDTPVDIYVLAGSTERDERVNAVLEGYAKQNDNIRLTNINTGENPTFGKKYVQNGAKLTANSVIVDAGDRYKMLSLSELYGINAQTGKYTSLNVENKITAALKYVSSKRQQTAYMINGHSELEASGAVKKLRDENYEVKELNLLTEAIPADASLIMIVRPLSDFSKDEISKLDAYLLSGGSLQVYFDVDSKQLENLYAYLRTVWGMSVEDNMVVETDTSKAVVIGGNGVTLVVPEIKDFEFTNSILKNKRTVAYFPYSKEITRQFEQNGDILTAPVLVSSTKAYTVTGSIAEKQENSKEGEFIVGALAQDKKHGSSVYVSGNTMLLTRDASVLSNDYGLANYDYLMNLINYTLDNGEGFTVDEKTLVNNSISVSMSGAIAVLAVTVILIPLIILAVGLAVWFRRRNL